MKIRRTLRKLYGSRIMKPVRLLVRLAVIAAITLGVVQARAEAPVAVAGLQTSPSGLKYIDTVVGTGAQPQFGQTVVVNYTGWLYENGVKGAKFDSSLDRHKPFEFMIGAHRVIPGWDEGVGTMRIGGKRTLIVPPELGYGARGAGGVIPPNATLIFDVELLGVK